MGLDDDALSAASVKINELGEVTANPRTDNGESVQVSFGEDSHCNLFKIRKAL